MKTGMITTFASIAALGVFGLAAAPAKADHGVIDVAFNIGPAYVRYHDGYHRVARVRPDYYGPRRHAYRVRNRFHESRDLWHHCWDGRWYRYYDRKHWRKHEKRMRRYYRNNGYYAPPRYRRGHRH